MYLLRCVLVSLSVFIIIYVGGSLAVSCLWGACVRAVRYRTPRRVSNLLYGLRMAPLALAMFSVAAFAVPSFLRFEPRSVEERIGVPPFVLSAFFLLLAGLGFFRVWRACSEAASSVRRWLLTGVIPDGGGTCPVFVSAANAPPVALAGVARSVLLVSVAARATLTAGELECAVAHELVHLRARDNLKKLLLLACGFPGMGKLEEAWLEWSEMTADADAVHTEDEALDLASALVKISRLTVSGSMPDLVSGLLHGPESLIERRVQSLLHWTARPPVESSSLLLPTSAVAAAALLIVDFSAALESAHVLTELLVR